MASSESEQDYGRASSALSQSFPAQVLDDTSSTSKELDGPCRAPFQHHDQADRLNETIPTSSWSSINIANTEVWPPAFPTQNHDDMSIFQNNVNHHQPASQTQPPSQVDILALLQGFPSIPITQAQLPDQPHQVLASQPYFPTSSTPDYSSYLNLDSPPNNDIQSNLTNLATPFYKTPQPQQNLTYLSHYLEAVVPLQYRLIARDMTNLIAQVASTHATVLAAASSLAALHLVTQRRKTMVPKTLPIIGAPLLEQWSISDSDARLALNLHATSLQSLKVVPATELTAEGRIISALFAMSFILFCGGTSKEWAGLYHTIQRCLAAALASSPEFNPNW